MADEDAPPLITLTTDFGTADGYVAAMKGVILSTNPRATIIDVTHEVRPQRIRQAVFLTQTAWLFFPAGSVHVAVVDPGVGTERRAIVLVSPAAAFVGPDNGVLSAALPDEARPTASEAGFVSLPAGYRAFSITNKRFFHDPISATFHGRDVFAPAAAHISLGAAPEELGDALGAVVALPPLRARKSSDGASEGRVLHIDRFGNVITDIRQEDLPSGEFVVEVAGQLVRGPVHTYEDAAGLVALVGSSGYLEVALRNGSAAQQLGVDIGAAVRLRSAS